MSKPKQDEENVDTSPATGLPVAHDRVTMLSRKADGTPDQVNPEIIGDKDRAIEANKEQLRQMSVSAVDAEKRREIAGRNAPDQGQDATVSELKEAHDKAAKAAEKQAEDEINRLHKGA